jgi:hypothetical protein
MNYQHVYAIVRVDKFHFPVEKEMLPLVVTVKKIVRERETAESEVERLNKLNLGKDCFYFWQVTRLVSD